MREQWLTSLTNMANAFFLYPVRDGKVLYGTCLSETVRRRNLPRSHGDGNKRGGLIGERPLSNPFLRTRASQCYFRTQASLRVDVS